MSRFFCKIYSFIDLNEDDQKEIIKKLRTNYKDYIVKPQKEGGGNNYYNEQILPLLPKEGKPVEGILKNTIIMERINPPEYDSYILHNNELKYKKCVSELGIYGAILSDENTFHLNRSFGFLLRTKESNVQEGGVVSGYSAIDLPKLI
jgi:glutathione synthase